MPEFLFRRKKQQSRRSHTLNDVVDAHQDIQAAKDKIKKKEDQPTANSAAATPKTARERVRKEAERNDSILREKDKFMELYKNKYPEDAARLGLTNGRADAETDGGASGREGGVARVNGEGATNSNGINHLHISADDSENLLPSSSDEASHDQSHDSSDSFIIKTTSTSELPTITSTPRKISKYDECLFLRYRKAIRRCPMPSPITLSTIKNLFVNMFDLSPALLNGPSCSLYIQDKASQQWAPLESMSMVTDHCTLQLKERSTKRTHKRGASQGDETDINTSSLDLSTSLKAAAITPLKSKQTSGSQRSLNVVVPSLTSKEKSPPEEGGRGVMGGARGGASIVVAAPLVKAGSQNNVDDLKATCATTLSSSTGHDAATKMNGLWQSGEVDDLTLLSDNHPVHQTQAPVSSGSDVMLTSPFSVTSSTSGVYSDPPMDQKKLGTMAHSLKASVKKLRSDMAEMRQDHIHQASAFSLSLLQARQKILSRLSVNAKLDKLGVTSGDLESFRRDRLRLYSMKEDYDTKAVPAFRELELLETNVESLRVDVVDRRCRVSEREVDELTKQVNAISRTVRQLEAGVFTPLEDVLKHVMEKELEVIVKEEKFVEEEGLRLDDAINKCRGLQTTLHNLNQYAVVQIHRTPMIPYFASEEEPDREALMDNIQSIHPNHRHRAKEIKKAEVIIQRRKEFTSSTKQELKQFEADLQTQRQSLKHVRRFSDIEDHRLMKAKEIFLKEKDVRRRHMEEELQMQGRLAVRKRENERRQFEEYLRWQQRGSRAMDELPAPGPVRKSKSHLSVISHDDDYDNDNDSYYVGRSGHKIPMYSTRSDDQVLPHFAAYNTGKGKPGSTPMHLLDDQRRHSALVGGDNITAKDDAPQSSGGGGGQGITGSSTYDSLAKMKESVDKLEKSSSSSSSRSSKAKSSTMDHQVKIYHSPLSQGPSPGTSMGSGSNSNSSSSIGRTKRRSSGGGNALNLQALTMLPGTTGAATTTTSNSSSSKQNSKLKQPSPLTTKRMDARNADGAVSHNRSDNTSSSSLGKSGGVPSSSRAATKGKKAKQMNGLPSGFELDFMNRGSLSQPVEDMTSEMYYPRTKFSPEVVPVSYEDNNQSSRNFYRSASDESVYDTLRASSRNSRSGKQVQTKDFNVKESKSWAKSFALSVFGSFTSTDKDKSKSSKHKHRHSQHHSAQQGSGGATGGQSATVFGSSNQSKTPSRYHHTYSHNQKPSKSKTSSSKKHTTTEMLSPDDQMEHKSVRFISTESRRQQQQQTPAGHTHDTGNIAHPNSAPQLSGIAARSPPTSAHSNGAQFSSDMPITSYPRSHTQAMQLRGHTVTNGNGRPLSNYNMMNVTRVTNGGGRGYSSRQYGATQNGPFKNSLSNNNLAELGSLV